jgi:hypothetical protein
MSLGTESIKNYSSGDEKAPPTYDNGVIEKCEGAVEDLMEQNEVFKKTEGGVDFRTVGWMRASVIFLKS